jgi:hypothetical protein
MKRKPRSKDGDVLRFIAHIGGTLLTQMNRFVKPLACGRRNASQSGGLSVILLLKIFFEFLLHHGFLCVTEERNSHGSGPQAASVLGQRELKTVGMSCSVVYPENQETRSGIEEDPSS